MVKKKSNPLNKRFLRELKSEAGKYIVLFVFIAGVIALVSGFLVASGSMSQAYDESFEKYNKLSYLKEEAGGIWEVEMMQKEKDDATKILELEKALAAANRQVTDLQMAICELYEKMEV